MVSDIGDSNVLSYVEGQEKNQNIVSVASQSVKDQAVIILREDTGSFEVEVDFDQELELDDGSMLTISETEGGVMYTKMDELGGKISDYIEENEHFNTLNCRYIFENDTAPFIIRVENNRYKKVAQSRSSTI